MRIEEVFNLLHPLDADGALGVVQSMRLVYTNTMLSRDGALILG